MRARMNNEEMLAKYTGEGTCGCQLTLQRKLVFLGSAGWRNAPRRLHVVRASWRRKTVHP